MAWSSTGHVACRTTLAMSESLLGGRPVRIHEVGWYTTGEIRRKGCPKELGFPCNMTRKCFRFDFTRTATTTHQWEQTQHAHAVAPMKKRNVTHAHTHVGSARVSWSFDFPRNTAILSQHVILRVVPRAALQFFDFSIFLTSIAARFLVTFLMYIFFFSRLGWRGRAGGGGFNTLEAFFPFLIFFDYFSDFLSILFFQFFCFFVVPAKKHEKNE